MKKLILVMLLAVVMLATACSEEDINDETEENSDEAKDQTETETEKQEEQQTEQDEEAPTEEEKADDTQTEDTEENKKDTIDTTMYEYTENIEITNALEINNHITLMIDINPETNQGTAFQHVLDGSYEFLKQESVQQADTIGINIRQSGTKIAMFTVHPKDFVPDDEKPMANMVLEASTVEMMSPDVEQYAEAFELPVEED